MKRLLALVAVVSLLGAVAAPAFAAKSTSRFALTGEARALELAIGDQGVTLGLAAALADSTPKVIGVGAGQCSLLGETADPSDVPCSDNNTEKSEWPANVGDDNATCAGGLPAPLDTIIDLDVACGSSKSFLKGGLPQSLNSGEVASLKAALPLEALLPINVDLPVEQVKEQAKDVVDTLVDTLQPVLDQTPQEVQDAAEQVVNTVITILETTDATDVVAAEIGKSVSNITGKGDLLKVDSSAAGARIGILGIPEATPDGETLITQANPLTNGLVIIEVGPSQATATANNLTADATAAASAAIVTVKVRDITKPEPSYVEVSVAPGETITVLEGTPAESTITAADTMTKESDGGAQAVADAVRLHLVKGVQGGIKLGLSRSVAAVNAAVVKPKAPVTKNAPKPQVLPLTGGTDYTVIAVGLIVLAVVALAVRRRLS